MASSLLRLLPRWKSTCPHCGRSPCKLDSGYYNTVDLAEIRNECLLDFRRRPRLKVPTLRICSEKHFIRYPKSKPDLAHYQPHINRICFSATYLYSATDEYVIDTMYHELIHCWIYQYGYDKPGEPYHGERFKHYCEFLGIYYNPEWR